MLRSVLDSAQTARAVRAVAGAKQALEYCARLGLNGERHGVTAPRHGAAVGAGVAVFAAAHQVDGFEPELERGQLGLLTQLPGDNLVGRNTGPDVGAFRLPRVNAGQEHGLRARMVAKSLRPAADRPRRWPCPS